MVTFEAAWRPLQPAAKIKVFIFRPSLTKCRRLRQTANPADVIWENGVVFELEHGSATRPQRNIFVYAAADKIRVESRMCHILITRAYYGRCRSRLSFPSITLRHLHLSMCQ